MSRRKLPPLRLGLVEMRKTLVLLKQGKLFTPLKKPKKERSPWTRRLCITTYAREMPFSRETVKVPLNSYGSV
jgi:hypothetical protein